MKSKRDKYLDQFLKEFRKQPFWQGLRFELPERQVDDLIGKSRDYLSQVLQNVAEQNYHKGFKRGFENGKIVGADEDKL